VLWPKENGPGIVDVVGQFGGVARGDVQVLGADGVGPAKRLLGVPRQDQGAEAFQARPGQVAALERRQLAFQGLLHFIQKRSVPGDQNARAGSCSAWAIKSAAT